VATIIHATIEELSEVVFSVVCATTIATQRHEKHASTTMKELFSMWSMSKGYQWDKFRAYC
jgi:hypothetical protein